MSSISDTVNQGLSRIGGTRQITPSSPQGQEAATSVAPSSSVQKVAQAGVTVTLTPEGRQAISRMEGFVATLGAARKSTPSQKPGSVVDMSI